jgi:hypothetical protein
MNENAAKLSKRNIESKIFKIKQNYRASFTFYRMFAPDKILFPAF